MKDALKPYPEFICPAPFKRIKKLAENVIDRGVNMGEGWLLPGEVAELIENGYNNIICAQAKDKNGTQSDVKCSETYKLDKTPPNITSLTGNGSAQELSANAMDEVSGVIGYNFSTSSTNANWNNLGLSYYSYTTKKSYSSSESGTKYFHVIDEAGNTAYKSYYLDMVKPTLSLSVTDATKYTKNKTATVTISDNVGLKSGTYTIFYGWSTSSYGSCGYSDYVSISASSGNTSKSAQINLSNKNGAGYLHVCVKSPIYDTSDNASTTYQDVYQSAYMDNQVPTIKKRNQTISSSGTVSVNFDLTDNVKLYGYYVNTSSSAPSPSSTYWAQGVSGTSYMLTVYKTTGTYYLHIRDEAGNIASQMFQVDGKAPTASLAVSYGTTYAKNRDATITISDDVGLKGGTYTIKYKWGNSSYAVSSGCSGGSSTSIRIPDGSKRETIKINISGQTGPGYIFVCPSSSIQDLSGNAMNYSSSTFMKTQMYLDNVAPIVNSATVVKNKVTFSGKDTNSGIKYYSVSKYSSNPAWNSITTTQSYSNYTYVQTTGTYYVHFKDVAGNIATPKRISVTAIK